MSTTTSRGSRQLEDLRAERDFLLSSLDDLEREHAAGDISGEDYETLRADYVGRAADALREIERLEHLAPAPKHRGAVEQFGLWRSFRRLLGRRSARRLLIVIGFVCLGGVAGISAAHLAGVRLPGESATGGVNVPTAELVRQELAEASVDGSNKQVIEAVDLYDAVLKTVPNQPEALTYRAWLIRLAGLQARSVTAVASADASLASAAAVAPRYPDARAFYGLALLEDEHALSAALVQFRAFATDSPSTNLLNAVAPTMVSAFREAHAAPPALLTAHRG